MKVLKWTSIKEYYDEATGLELTKKEVDIHYIIKKTIRDVKLITKINRINLEEYQEGEIYYRSICSRSGKQLSIPLD